jgi:hypothetical protein
MHTRVVLLACVALLMGEWSCASPPPWKMPPGLPSSGSRVRVVAPSLGSAWQPGRVVLSTAGCWIVQAAVTNDPKAITELTPRQLTRLQVSEALPPPDWWVVPEDAEGWSEMLPSVLDEASTSRCRRTDSLASPAPQR